MSKIRSTLDSISREDFALASEAIVNAKRIYIIGMRSSASLASFIAFNFRFMFDNVTLVQTTSGSEIFEQMLRVTEDDVVIAISFPRYSKRIISAVEFAHMQGAHVVALTDSALSPIAIHANSALYAKSDMASFVDSHAAPLSIINAIVVAVAREKNDELSVRLRKLEEIWDEYEVYDKTLG
jgi:DNA-binding MurR/RpiR family transcriptional regulator